MTYQVTAHDFSDRLVALVTGLRDRTAANAEAERLFARGDVNRVAVTAQTPKLQNGNGRYR